MSHEIQEKPKQKYKVTEHGHFTRTRIVTLDDDYNSKTDSFGEFINEVLEDDFHKETDTFYFEAIK